MEFVSNNLNQSTAIKEEEVSFALPFSSSDVALTATILIFLTIFAILANLTTICVITSSSNLKTAFNFLIGSLCVSDVVSAFITPLFLYRRTWGFEEWQISAFACKMVWGLRLWTAYVTSIHILLFSLLRCVSVQSATNYYQISNSLMQKVIFLVWAITFLVGFIPFAVMFDKLNRDADLKVDSWAARPSCTVAVKWESTYLLYTAVAYSVLFYIPLIFIIVLSIATIHILYKKRKNRREIISSKPHSPTKTRLEDKRKQNETQVMIQLLLIVASYALGYLPFSIYGFYTISTPSSTLDERKFDWRFGVAELICLRISECLNPIFYNLASSNMRKETVNYIRRCFGLNRAAYTFPSERYSSTMNDKQLIIRGITRKDLEKDISQSRL